MKNRQSGSKIAIFPIFPGPIYVPYGHRPKFIFSLREPSTNEALIPENILDTPDIWVWSNIAGSYPILNQIFRRECLDGLDI